MCENVGFECVKMFAKGVKQYVECVKMLAQGVKMYVESV